jgi:4-O-beta-D-mannosyl-D-glucose phosphorylase
MGGGIAWGLSDSIEHARVEQELVIDHRIYHTIKEVKNGLGPAPIRTPEGWLHLAHGVRNTAAGLRYVLYMFLTSLTRPEVVLYAPGGYFLAPSGGERIGDVSNVVFSNGWVARESGELFIYYGSSDTRTHVATTTVERLLDYVIHTPPDALRSAACVRQRNGLIARNLEFMKMLQDS